MQSLTQPGRSSLQRAGSSPKPAWGGGPGSPRRSSAADTPALSRTEISMATIALYLRKGAKTAPARRDRGAGPHTVAAALRHRGFLPRLTGGRVVFQPQPRPHRAEGALHERRSQRPLKYSRADLITCRPADLTDPRPVVLTWQHPAGSGRPCA